MELLAVIKGLEALKKPNTEILVYSDSKYVVDSVEKGWLKSWIKKNFKDKKNPDLWMRYQRIAQHHRVSFKWIKGHAGHQGNERCDELAVESALGSDLQIDVGYENSKK